MPFTPCQMQLDDCTTDATMVHRAPCESGSGEIVTTFACASCASGALDPEEFVTLACQHCNATLEVADYGDLVCRDPECFFYAPKVAK